MVEYLVPLRQTFFLCASLKFGADKQYLSGGSRGPL